MFLSPDKRVFLSGNSAAAESRANKTQGSFKRQALTSIWLDAEVPAGHSLDVVKEDHFPLDWSVRTRTCLSCRAMPMEQGHPMAPESTSFDPGSCSLIKVISLPRSCLQDSNTRSTNRNTNTGVCSLGPALYLV